MKEKSPIKHVPFEKLFKEHYALLCLVSLSILRDEDAASDVVQDFFISYWQRRKIISINTSFQAYAVKAVKNLSFIAIKKAIKEKSLAQNLNEPVFVVQKTLDNPNRYDKIFNLLNQLPKCRKEIFISFVVHGQSYSEIAESNGISINTVKTQMKRSYAFLRSNVKNKDIYYLLLMSLSSLLF
ncbi:sigma-70 family RNA polymerase sigma factor [Maribacter sp. ACAM166]|uniref:sigma-70 family RNA polymerase sigma factor n=1 Tax=Maribacter sp. ACAM166 TaxID=2508996 RepID=UPI0014850438|nr:sigma-70 family RNA polymerase sigma factor [Maribacter sp. ACAM166]